MNDRCDHCGREMLQADYDVEHATIHIGTSGRHPELGVFFGDAWYLLCHECLLEWREKFGGWLRGDA